MRKDFGEWLRDEINKTGKTQKEFAQLIGIEQPQLSKILSGVRGTTDEVLRNIATVLGLPPETVFRVAGLLPPKTEQSQKIDEAVHLLKLLETDDLEEIIQITRLKIERKTTSTKSRSKRPARSVLKD